MNSAGTVKFGQLQNVSVPLNRIMGALVIGVIGGALGSLFIFVNGFMGRLRKRIIKSNWMKLIETGLFGVATISTMTLIVVSFSECITHPPKPDPIPGNSTV